MCDIGRKVAESNRYAAERGWGIDAMARNPNRMQEATDLLMGKFQQGASVVISYTQGSTVITLVTNLNNSDLTPVNQTNTSVVNVYHSIHSKT